MTIKKLATVSLAATLVVLSYSLTPVVQKASAGLGPAPAATAATSVASGGSNAGGWIVGGIFISVASIITCAMIVGFQEDREMTLEEALLSGAVPLGCLLREELGVDGTP